MKNDQHYNTTLFRNRKQAIFSIDGFFITTIAINAAHNCGLINASTWLFALLTILLATTENSIYTWFAKKSVVSSYVDAKISSYSLGERMESRSDTPSQAMEIICKTNVHSPLREVLTKARKKGDRVAVTPVAGLGE